MRNMTSEAKKRKIKSDILARVVYIPNTKKIDGKKYFRMITVYTDRTDAIKVAERKRKQGFSARIDPITPYKKDLRIKVYVIWLRKSY